MKDITYPIRINRYLALKNFCSRREADGFISKKIVKINGRIAILGDRVNEGDSVEVDVVKKGHLKKYQYLAYNKPMGIVTHTPEKGQKEIKKVANLAEGIFPIGRLDKDSHGLILLSNDGRVTGRLLSPEANTEKEYVVKVNKKINNFFIRHMSEGIDLEDFRTRECEVKMINENTFRIILTEGKKHQIRRMCTALGYEVWDLKRVRVANIRLANLKPNEKREIAGEEREIFLKNLGI